MASGGAAKEEQIDELISLDSIFNDDYGSESRKSSDKHRIFGYHECSESEKYLHQGHLTVQIHLANTLNVVSERSPIETIQVKHLPPLELIFSLPKDYPVNSRPDFKIRCLWLSPDQIDKLNTALISVWEANAHSVILYLWYDKLLHETLDILNISDTFYIPQSDERKSDSKIAENSFKVPSPSIKEREVEGDGDEFLTGEIKVWYTHKKYGFIIENKTKEKYLAHYKQFTNGFKDFHKLKGKSVIFIEDVKTKDCQKKSAAKITVKLQGNRPEDKIKDTINNITVKDSEISTGNMSIIKIIKDNHNFQENRVFQKTYTTCEICFDDVIGANCTRFTDCNHSFCNSCLKSFFRINIEEGSVTRLICPQENCKTEALPHQVKALIPPEMYQKYESRYLDVTLSKMDDIMICPRIHCQIPVIIDKKNSIGNCSNPNCLYVFCILCKSTYHGQNPCKIKTKESLSLITEYLNGDENQRFELEKRHGKKQLELLSQEYLSETFKENNSKICPRCSASIQKSEGCNKMTCSKCNCNFCYLCGNKISSANPYDHFKDLKSPCYNLLFEGDDEEDDDYFDYDEFEEEEDFQLVFFA